MSSSPHKTGPAETDVGRLPHLRSPTASKRIVITQSNYVPWKGYFDAINLADEVVLYDDMQYTKRDWRNRNRIKTKHGVQWLTVPVEVKGRYEQRINETRISDPTWGARHWASLQHAYARAPCFDEVGDVLGDYLRTTHQDLLSSVNRDLIAIVCAMLGIDTMVSSSSDYHLIGGPTEKLVGVCLQAGATEYLTGPAARAYLDEEAFAAHDIAVTYLDYSGYPEYPQLWGEFEHAVSILDLLFNVGAERATTYMKSFG